MRTRTRKISVAFVLWAIAVGALAALASAQTPTAEIPPPPAVSTPPTPPPAPWGGAKVTKEQGLELENATLRIELLRASINLQASQQFDQGSAPFKAARDVAVAEVLKKNPGWAFDENQVMFYKLPSPAKPKP